VVVAFHPADPVGVDVERIKPALSPLELARHVLTGDETATLRRLDPAQARELDAMRLPGGPDK
jgi:phosphopantetheinyl transferase